MPVGRCWHPALSMLIHMMTWPCYVGPQFILRSVRVSLLWSLVTVASGWLPWCPHMLEQCKNMLRLSSARRVALAIAHHGCFPGYATRYTYGPACLGFASTWPTACRGDGIRAARGYRTGDYSSGR